MCSSDLLDLRMPGRSGLEVLEEIHQRWPRVRVLVVTGAAPDGLARSAIGLGAHAVLLKPFRINELRAMVRSVLADAVW